MTAPVWDVHCFYVVACSGDNHTRKSCVSFLSSGRLHFLLWTWKDDIFWPKQVSYHHKPIVASDSSILFTPEKHFWEQKWKQFGKVFSRLPAAGKLLQQSIKSTLYIDSHIWYGFCQAQAVKYQTPISLPVESILQPQEANSKCMTVHSAELVLFFRT